MPGHEWTGWLLVPVAAIVTLALVEGPMNLWCKLAHHRHWRILSVSEHTRTYLCRKCGRRHVR